MSERNCYCDLWKTSRREMEKSGIPPGYCGTCRSCGAPGHTRHAPNGPYTSAWCDRCYRRLELRTQIGHWLLTGLAASALAYALAAWWVK